MSEMDSETSASEVAKTGSSNQLCHRHARSASCGMLSLHLIALATSCNRPLEPGELPHCPSAAVKGGLHIATLCEGMNKLLTASCVNLSSQSFLEQTICEVGLTHLGPRTTGIYGAVSSKCVRARGTGGVCQQPSQLASALLILSTEGVRSYLELGVATGWTAAFITSYLRRFSPQSVIRGIGLDISFHQVSVATQSLLDANKVDLQLRRKPPHLATAEHIDLCFIDGDHSYAGVYKDYKEFHDKCRLFMFHDVADFDSAIIDPAGGTPRFWADITANAESPGSYREYFHTPGAFPATLGIGIILRHAPPLPFTVQSTASVPYKRAHVYAPRDLLPALPKAKVAAMVETKIAAKAKAKKIAKATAKATAEEQVKGQVKEHTSTTLGLGLLGPLVWMAAGGLLATSIFWALRRLV